MAIFHKNDAATDVLCINCSAILLETEAAVGFYCVYVKIVAVPELLNGAGIKAKNAVGYKGVF